jgi:5-methylcytosine-specific restriction enzyme A
LIKDVSGLRPEGSFVHQADFEARQLMADWPYNTTAWQRLRRLKLQTTPLCEACAKLDRLVFAKAVDHIIAVKDGGEAFPPLDGLMSLC